MVFVLLGSDLNPLEEHELRFSLRKSFNILGLLSIELNLLSCTTSIFKNRNGAKVINIQLVVVVVIQYYNGNGDGVGMRQKSVEAWMVLND
ncbi:hypothetical protein P8452_74383 [Trifolium repens]|nr:hypothetical protein P8452_74383 [Trifolium repens]